MVSIPGVGVVRLSDPVYPGSHFNWNEVTRDGARIPRDTWYRGELVSAENIYRNIVNLAKELDLIRSEFGNNPITINSWYRPPEINGAVDGAAKDSYHIIGIAADIVVRNRSASAVYRGLDAK